MVEDKAEKVDVFHSEVWFLLWDVIEQKACMVPHAEFFFGWFLYNRGAKERAAALWKLCAEVQTGTKWVKMHAWAWLEDGVRKKD